MALQPGAQDKPAARLVRWLQRITNLSDPGIGAMSSHRDTPVAAPRCDDSLPARFAGLQEGRVAPAVAAELQQLERGIAQLLQAAQDRLLPHQPRLHTQWRSMLAVFLRTQLGGLSPDAQLAWLHGRHAGALLTAALSPAARVAWWRHLWAEPSWTTVLRRMLGWESGWPDDLVAPLSPMLPYLVPELDTRQCALIRDALVSVMLARQVDQHQLDIICVARHLRTQLARGCAVQDLPAHLLCFAAQQLETLLVMQPPVVHATPRMLVANAVLQLSLPIMQALEQLAELPEPALQGVLERRRAPGVPAWEHARLAHMAHRLQTVQAMVYRPRQHEAQWQLAGCHGEVPDVGPTASNPAHARIAQRFHQAQCQHAQDVLDALRPDVPVAVQEAVLTRVDARLLVREDRARDAAAALVALERHVFSDAQRTHGARMVRSSDGLPRAALLPGAAALDIPAGNTRQRVDAVLQMGTRLRAPIQRVDHTMPRPPMLAATARAVPAPQPDPVWARTVPVAADVTRLAHVLRDMADEGLGPRALDTAWMALDETSPLSTEISRRAAALHALELQASLQLAPSPPQAPRGAFPQHAIDAGGMTWGNGSMLRLEVDGAQYAVVVDLWCDQARVHIPFQLPRTWIERALALDGLSTDILDHAVELGLELRRDGKVRTSTLLARHGRAVPANAPRDVLRTLADAVLEHGNDTLQPLDPARRMLLVDLHALARRAVAADGRIRVGRLFHAPAAGSTLQDHVAATVAELGAWRDYLRAPAGVMAAQVEADDAVRALLAPLDLDQALTLTLVPRQRGRPRLIVMAQAHETRMPQSIALSQRLQAHIRRAYPQLVQEWSQSTMAVRSDGGVGLCDAVRWHGGQLRRAPRASDLRSVIAHLRGHALITADATMQRTAAHDASEPTTESVPVSTASVSEAQPDTLPLLDASVVDGALARLERLDLLGMQVNTTQWYVHPATGSPLEAACRTRGAQLRALLPGLASQYGLQSPLSLVCCHAGGRPRMLRLSGDDPLVGRRVVEIAAAPPSEEASASPVPERTVSGAPWTPCIRHDGALDLASMQAYHGLDDGLERQAQRAAVLTHLAEIPGMQAEHDRDDDQRVIDSDSAQLLDVLATVDAAVDAMSEPLDPAALWVTPWPDSAVTAHSAPLVQWLEQLVQVVRRPLGVDTGVAATWMQQSDGHGQIVLRAYGEGMPAQVLDDAVLVAALAQPDMPPAPVLQPWCGAVDDSGAVTLETLLHWHGLEHPTPLWPSTVAALRERVRAMAQRDEGATAPPADATTGQPGTPSVQRVAMIVSPALAQVSIISGNATLTRLGDVVLDAVQAALPAAIKSAGQPAGRMDNLGRIATLLSAEENLQADMASDVDALLASARWSRFRRQLDASGAVPTGMASADDRAMVGLVTLLRHDVEQVCSVIERRGGGMADLKHSDAMLATALDGIRWFAGHLAMLGHDMLAVEAASTRLTHRVLAATLPRPTLHPLPDAHEEEAAGDRNAPDARQLNAQLLARLQQMRQDGTVDLDRVLVEPDPKGVASARIGSLLAWTRALAGRMRQPARLTPGAVSRMDVVRMRYSKAMAAGGRLELMLGPPDGELRLVTPARRGRRARSEVIPTYVRHWMDAWPRHPRNMTGRVSEDGIPLHLLAGINGYPLPRDASANMLRAAIDHFNTLQLRSPRTRIDEVIPGRLALERDPQRPTVTVAINRPLGAHQGYADIEAAVAMLRDAVRRQLHGQRERIPLGYPISEQERERAMITALMHFGIPLTGRIRDTHLALDIYPVHEVLTAAATSSLDAWIDQAFAPVYRDIRHEIEVVQAEGVAIIAGVDLSVILPNLIAPVPLFGRRLIQACDVRDPRTQLFLDPLAQDAGQVMGRLYLELDEELANGGATLGAGTMLSRCVAGLLAADNIDLATQDEASGRRSVDAAIRELMAARLAFAADVMKDSQRALVVEQLGMVQDVATELCRFLGLEDRHWWVLAMEPLQVRTTANWHFFPFGARGSIVERRTYARTLLQILGDEYMRKKLAYVDKQSVVEQLVSQLTERIGGAVDESMLTHQMARLFELQGVPPFGWLVNDGLPEPLRSPRTWFSKRNTAYVERAMQAFRSNEAQRLLWSSPRAVERLRTGNLPDDHEETILALLSDAERQQLEVASEQMRQWLGSRLRVRDLAELTTATVQMLRSMGDILAVVPVVGDAVGLAGAIAENDRDGMRAAVSGLLAMGLGGRGPALMRRSTRAMGFGLELYERNEQIQAIKRALQAGDGVEASNLMAYLISGSSSQVRASIRLVRNAIVATPRIHQTLHLPAARSRSMPHIDPVPQALQLLWRPRHDGVLQQVDRRQCAGEDRRGNVYFNDATRATLHDIEQGIYLHGGQPWIRVGGELRTLASQGLLHVWAQSTASQGRFVRGTQGASIPRGQDDMARGTVPWFDAREVTPDPSTGLAALEHKYLSVVKGRLNIVEHAGVRDGITTLFHADGRVQRLRRVLPTIPAYAPSPTARLIARRGVFVGLELESVVEGVADVRTSSGVLVPAKGGGGGHALVAEADEGVLYRAWIPADEMPAVMSGRTLSLARVSPLADAKRASPARWAQDEAYRRGAAEDDFHAELYLASRTANRLATHDYATLARHLRIIEQIMQALPAELRSVDNPYFVLDTRPEWAFRCAPRNAVALSMTLLQKDVAWGQVTRPQDRGFVEQLLRHMSRADGERVFDASEQLPQTARGIDAVSTQLVQQSPAGFTCMRVTARDGTTTWMLEEPDGAYTLAIPQERVLRVDDVVRALHTDFPAPRAVQDIQVFSPRRLADTRAIELFHAVQRGYPLVSVTWGAESTPDAGVLRTTTQSQDIAPVTRSMSGTRAIVDGPRQGARTRDGVDYIQLDGHTYRAEYSNARGGFALVPPDGREPGTTESLPFVRRTAQGGFALVNRPGAPTRDAHGVALSDIADDPTPTRLEVQRLDGTELVIVADPKQVIHDVDGRGQAVLWVDGVAYRRGRKPDEHDVLTRASDEDVVVRCSARGRRGIDGAVACTSGGLSLVSRGSLNADAMPRQGHDTPEVEVFTPGVADIRMRPTSLGVGRDALQVVAYDRHYQRLSPDDDRPKRLKPAQRQALGLPDVPVYAQQVQATLRWRVGHGAQVEIARIDAQLPASSVVVGASLFRPYVLDDDGEPTRRLATDEHAVFTWDGGWWFGHLTRADGEPTPTRLDLQRVDERDQQAHHRELKRIHAGMLVANYHARHLGEDSMRAMVDAVERSGVTDSEFTRCRYYSTSTTAAQAYVFDKLERRQTQILHREGNDQLAWHRLDPDADVGMSTPVARAQSSVLDVARHVFPGHDIGSIEALMTLSRDPVNFELKGKNVMFAIADNDVYITVSGRPRTEVGSRRNDATPRVFRDQPVRSALVDGRIMRLNFIDADMEMQQHLERLDADPRFPQALPTPATAADIADPTYMVTQSRAHDTERKLAAWMLYSREREGQPMPSSLVVFNRNDACLSCAATLEVLFRMVPGPVIHIFGKDYLKY